MTTRTTVQWHEPIPSEAPSPDLLRVVDHHPLLATILHQRGIKTPDAARAFLFPDHYTPAPPDALPDLVQAAERLDAAIAGGERILIWGDFDVDGQTSTALLVDALRGLGADVAFYIPHRLRESHGILVESLAREIETHRPAVLLTCDTGVSAHEAIEYANAQGLATLITDHHDLPPELPAANAVVDPKRLPEGHPLRTLPGVGVTYKLIQHLYAQHGRSAELPRFLDLVALGIVADVAEQTNDTRYLLQLGMDELRHTNRIGLRVLYETAGVNPDYLSTSDIGFQIGPRLNAAGRLDDARPVVELFTTSDQTRARILAQHLEGLNNQRRLQNRQIYAAAQEQIARDPGLLDWEALVIAHPGWHPGIIGIVASRLAELYQRPVVLLSIDENGLARGSARSAPGYDIGAAIAAQADLLTQFGGHPGAAGLSLPENNIPAFRRRLSNTLQETRDPDARTGIAIDAFVDLADVTLTLATDLRRLAPFGEGNPPVTLATRDLTLRDAALIGRTREHRRLSVEDAHGNHRNVLWWNSADQALPDTPFDLAYQVSISTYNDAPELQLTLTDYRRAASAPVPVKKPQRTVIDHRDAADLDVLLVQLATDYPGAITWAEGYQRAASPGVTLDMLAESPTLIVYTTPTGPQALQEALERTKPATIILVGVDPPLQGLKAVLHRTLQLAKHVINQHDGYTTLGALAGATGQSRRTLEAVLDYFAARGEITLTHGPDDAITIAPGSQAADPDTVATALEAVRAHLAETAAYRAHFRRAQPQHLLGEYLAS